MVDMTQEREERISNRQGGERRGKVQLSLSEFKYGTQSDRLCNVLGK